jgi:quinol monooxygenase YgiN
MRAAYVLDIDVDPAAEDRWFRWEVDEHIPLVLREPGFLEASLYRVDGERDGWLSYRVHYILESREALDAYLGGEAVQRLRADAMAKYGSVMRIARSNMEERVRLEP